MTIPGRTNGSGTDNNGKTPVAYVVPGSDSAGRYGMITRLVGNRPEYVDPSPTVENYYIDNPASAGAPSFRITPDGTPDARRLGTIPIYDYRPQPLTQAPGDWYQDPDRGPGFETQRRHNSTEFVDADGMQLYRPTSYPDKRAAPDPRRTPPPESRVTQQMNPHRYVYTRPFDQHARRQLNGDHFSMADHRRNYPILGMAPVGWKRNTYRADPTPWDTNRIDYPTNAEDAYRGAGGYVSADPPWRSGRSGRLD